MSTSDDRHRLSDEEQYSLYCAAPEAIQSYVIEAVEAILAARAQADPEREALIRERDEARSKVERVEAQLSLRYGADGWGILSDGVRYVAAPRIRAAMNEDPA